MLAMLCECGRKSLRAVQLPTPQPAAEQVLIRVTACGVCRTDLHVVDGELPPVRQAVIPGHEIVGRVVQCGPGVDEWRLGDRVGVPWLGDACGRCRYCLRGQENLCERAGFTGYTLDGGYADHVVANARFVFRIPDLYTDEQAAPLLCAGLIGYRALKMAGDPKRLGIYGFGAAAHIIAQLAIRRGIEVYAFTRRGDASAQSFARGLGATWAGDSDTGPPVVLDSAIIFAPVGALVPQALQHVDRGGIVVCAGIHMSDLPAMPYSLLWQERVLRSVANLTRADGREFFELAAQARIETHTRPYELSRANDALADLREGRLTGAAVLVI